MFAHLPTEDGWHDRFADSIAPTEALRAWLEPWLHTAMEQGLAEPHIYPTTKGGILFIWDEAVDPSSVCVYAAFNKEDKSVKVEFTDLWETSEGAADSRDYVFDLSDEKQSTDLVKIVNMANEHQEPPSVLYDKIEKLTGRW